MEELKPIHANEKSFYKKAYVEELHNVKTLYSYKTKVAYVCDGVAVVINKFSNTTMRHIKEFLKQEGFEVDSSKQILEDYKNGI